MVFITGDTHGILDQGKLNSLDYIIEDADPSLSEQHYLIVLGDFGMLWKSFKDEIELGLEEFYGSKPYITLFLDGNHENFNRLDNLEQIRMFDGTVGKVTDKVFHLRRGEIYNIRFNKFFVFGGAFSIDRNERTWGKSIWKQEIPNDIERKYALENLKLNNFEVDYVLTHTGPDTICNEYLRYRGWGPLHQWPYDEVRNVELYLDQIKKQTTYYKWLFGHWHEDWTSSDGKHIMMYNKIHKIT